MLFSSIKLKHQKENSMYRLNQRVTNHKVPKIQKLIFDLLTAITSFVARPHAVFVV
jgi:hypothetical protein